MGVSLDDALLKKFHWNQVNCEEVVVGSMSLCGRGGVDVISLYACRLGGGRVVCVYGKGGGGSGQINVIHLGQCQGPLTVRTMMNTDVFLRSFV